MDAWPAKLDGLSFQLPSGWYELPHYMERGYQHRLLELLSAGVAGIEYIVYFHFDNLANDSGQLSLSRSLVLLTVPSATSEDALRLTLAKLGSVRIGLLQREEPSSWADVAWQERYLKTELLSWLKRDLHRPTHPFGQLGVSSLPVDALAKLTAEPVELISMVREVLARRLSGRVHGMEHADWMRSVEDVTADRLARRLAQIEKTCLPSVLDFLRAPVREFPLTEQEQHELAKVGLGWKEGNDIQLGPMANLTRREPTLERLGRLLTEQAWSEAGKRALGRLSPPPALVPRANLLLPDPQYTTWPVFQLDLQELARHALVGHGFEPAYAEAFASELHTALLVQAGARSLADAPALDFAEIASLRDIYHALLWELQDEALVQHDFERGQIHRFDGLDRHCAGSHLGWLRAFLRWKVVAMLIRQAKAPEHYEVLLAEVRKGLEYAEEHPFVCAALECLAGDLCATAQHYARARQWWGRIDVRLEGLSGWPPGERSEALSWGHIDSWLRLKLRLAFLSLRCDDLSHVRELFFEPPLSDYLRANPTQQGLNFDLISVFQLHFLELDDTLERRLGRVTKSEDLLPRRFLLMFTVSSALAEAGVAQELEDLPKFRAALHKLADLPPQTTPAEASRARLLETYLWLTSGELDEAGNRIEGIISEATQRGDRLLLALALRARAIVGRLRSSGVPHDTAYLADLERALEIEGELELPDAALVELELVGWKSLLDPRFEARYNELVHELREAPSASLRAAALSSRFQRMAAELSNATLQELAIDVESRIEALESISSLPQAPGWALRACRELIRYMSTTTHPVDDGASERLERLIETFGATEQDLRAWLLHNWR